MVRNALFAALLLTLGAAAAAQGAGIQINRAVFIERVEDGERLLEPANELRRGDTVVLVMRWKGAADGRPVMLSSTVPGTLAYQRSGMQPEAVSVDGGENWGRLGSLRHRGRIAGPGDITNLRWRVPARSGTLTYSATVR